MKPKANQSSESVVREIKRKTRRKFQSDEKIRIILDGLKGEDSIASICRREGISPSVYCKWSKAFLQAGKRKLKGIRSERPVAMKYQSFAKRTSSSSSLWQN